MKGLVKLDLIGYFFDETDCGHLKTSRTGSGKKLFYRFRICSVLEEDYLILFNATTF